jgi:hypothetical protein
MLFGAVFAMAVPALRNAFAVVGAAFAYGLLLYVVNFLVFGTLIFEWFAPGGVGPNQIFERIIHPTAYGLILAPFFLTYANRPQPGTRNDTSAARRDEDRLLRVAREAATRS